MSGKGCDEDERREASVLKEELDYFATHKEDLLQHNRGKFALIKGSELIDTFTTDQQAYEAGVKRFGSEPFLIKEIVDEEAAESLPALTIGLIRARP